MVNKTEWDVKYNNQDLCEGWYYLQYESKYYVNKNVEMYVKSNFLVFKSNDIEALLGILRIKGLL